MTGSAQIYPDFNQQPRVIKVLLIDDDEDDYILIRRLLKNSIYRWDANTEVTFEIDWTPFYDKALEAVLNNRYDAYLIDYYLQGRTGVELVEATAKNVVTAPMIILTGKENYQIDATAAKAGAANYLVKQHINELLLERSLRFAIERKQTEEKLRRAHELTSLLTQELFRANQQMQTILKTMPAGVLIVNSKGKIIHQNDMLQAIFGTPPSYDHWLSFFQQLKGWWAKTGDPIRAEEWALSRSLQNGELSLGEVIDIERFDGKKATILLSASPIPSQNGEISGAVCVCLDITQQTILERKVQASAIEAQEIAKELQAKRNQLLNVISHAPSAFLFTDNDGGIIIANESAEALFGNLASQRIENLSSLPFEYPDGRPYPAEDLPFLRSLAHRETHINAELALVKPNGERLYLLVNSSPVLDNFGSTNGSVIIFQDVTRRKAEEEDARLRATRIQVQQHLIKSQEMERLRIARDLHDGPLQELIGIHLALDDIQHQTESLSSSKNNAKVSRLLEEIKKLKSDLKQQINDLRGFSSELRPPFLLEFGLEHAIRIHLKKFQEKEPNCKLDIHLQPDLPPLPEQITLALFRIFQEILNNVSKHAGADHISVRLSASSDRVSLSVSDNGKGFMLPDSWVPLIRKGHLGLVGIQERARSVGGNVNIRSYPGAGTVIEVWTPLALEREEEEQTIFPSLATTPPAE